MSIDLFLLLILVNNFLFLCGVHSLPACCLSFGLIAFAAVQTVTGRKLKEKDWIYVVTGMLSAFVILNYNIQIMLHQSDSDLQMTGSLLQTLLNLLLQICFRF